MDGCYALKHFPFSWPIFANDFSKSRALISLTIEVITIQRWTFFFSSWRLNFLKVKVEFGNEIYHSFQNKLVSMEKKNKHTHELRWVFTFLSNDNLKKKSSLPWLQLIFPTCLYLSKHVWISVSASRQDSTLLCSGHNPGTWSLIGRF